jgi:hypothetical protein
MDMPRPLNEYNVTPYTHREHGEYSVQIATIAQRWAHEAAARFTGEEIRDILYIGHQVGARLIQRLIFDGVIFEVAPNLYLLRADFIDTVLKPKVSREDMRKAAIAAREEYLRTQREEYDKELDAALLKEKEEIDKIMKDANRKIKTTD